MTEPVRLVITMEGGLIQDVISGGLPIEVLVIDYDTDGNDPAETVLVPQGDGYEPEPAYVHLRALTEPTALADDAKHAARLFAALVDEKGELKS